MSAGTPLNFNNNGAYPGLMGSSQNGTSAGLNSNGTSGNGSVNFGLVPQPKATPQTVMQQNFTGNGTSSANTSLGTNPGLLHQTPTTPVKSITTKADGSTTSTYHAPTDATLDIAPNNGVDPAGTGNNMVAAPANTIPTPVTGSTANPISSMSNSAIQAPIGGTATQPSQNQQAVSGLLATQQGGETPEVATAQQNIQNLTDSYANSLAGIQQGPGEVNAETGVEGVLQQKYGTQLDAAQQALSTAQTAQGQQIGAGESAASQTSPVGQFGLLTNPQTGQPLNPSIANNAIQQAYQLVQNGASINDPTVQAIISPFGTWGQQALTSALNGASGGTFNPTSQATQVATNQSNASATQTQNYSLQTALKFLNNVAPIATNFIAQSGLNSTTSPLYNQPIDKYIATLGNTGAATQANAIMNDVQSAAQQIIANKTPGTPTNNDEMQAAQDPSLLNAQQLQSVLSTWASLGQAQTQALSQQQSGAYGNTGGYTGASNAPSPTSIPVAAPNTNIGSGVTSPGQQTEIGLLQGAASWASGVAQNIGSDLLSFIAGHAL